MNDLSILKLVAPPAPGQPQGSRPFYYDLNFGAEPGTLSGVQKVAQEFIIFFLSYTGTSRYQSDYGTEFVARASVGAIRTAQDAFTAFTQAANDMSNYVTARLVGAEDEDEVFGSAVFKGVVAPGTGGAPLNRLTVTGTVSTLAGTTLDILIPVRPVEIK